MPIKTTLSSKDIEKIIAQADNLRDRLIVMFYFDTGVRCSELLQITYGNIDLAQKSVLISHLKRGTHKICPLCNKRAGHATAFCSKCGNDLSRVEAVGIKERKRLIDIGDDLVEVIKEFTEEKYTPDQRLISLTRQAVYDIIRKLAKSAGLGGRIMLNPESGKKHYVHVHSFRDALATDWLEMAKNDVQKQKALSMHLGHVDFSTTMRYDKLTPHAINETRNEVRNFRKGGK